MTREYLINDYFKYLVELIYSRRRIEAVSFMKLLTRLHETEFRYSMRMDENRAEDGIALRWRYALTHGFEDDPDYVMDRLEGPCSVLEMMTALAIHCEENIMDDTSYGDRTEQWFWGMIVSLGLGGMTDKNFDRELVDEKLAIFLDREYEPDGRGGLFTVKNCDRDLRTVEIWRQLSYYLNSII